jgi:hypothetical protein
MPDPVGGKERPDNDGADRVMHSAEAPRRASVRPVAQGYTLGKAEIEEEP